MQLARAHVLVEINDESLLAGAEKVLAALEKAVESHGLAGEVRIVETGDLGASGTGVILAVHPDGVIYAGVTVEDVDEIVEEHLLKGRFVERLRAPTSPPLATGLVRDQARIVLENCGRIDPESLEEAIAGGAYEALATIAEQSLRPEDVLETVKSSGLRGRGGAGFPTGLKWSFTASGEEKYIVCNADEGEPGTFKDRLILEGDPHRLIEGMILAGYAVGAGQGYIYIRGEYALSIRRIQIAIDQARGAGLLGPDILGTGFGFDIDVKKGAGAYVCGEETALIESMEGKRGNPRLKPPYPGAVGLWDKPTVVNNVETLANVPPIIARGADWFRTFGTPSCPGTKVYTILGHAANPGLIEVEMGTTLRSIVFDYGGGLKNGKSFKAALIGGAAGAFVGIDGLDVKMDFDNLKEYAAVLGSGAILVMDETVSIVKVLQGILHFFRHESCGQCAPCRLGTAQMCEIADRIASGTGSDKDVDLLREIAEVMRETSLCPLGQSPILPIETALDRFGDEFVTGSAGAGAASTAK